MFDGSCRDWYNESVALETSYTVHEFESDKRVLVDPLAWTVALPLFQFKHEITAEKYLQHYYPTHGPQRAAFYLDMQTENLKNGKENLPLALLPFSKLLEVLRTGLGCAISNETLIGHATKLDALARNDLLASSRPDLIDFVPALLNVGVDPIQADLDVYHAIFDMTLRANPPVRAD